MKKTLLQVVQTYLTYSNGTEVDDIFYSDEAIQASYIAEEMYYRILDKAQDIQFVTKLRTLDHVGDVSKPNYLRIPDEVTWVQDMILKYNKDTDEKTVNYQNVKYLDPRDFLDKISANTNTLPNSEIIQDFGGTQFVIRNNKHPEYYTSFDGEYLVFDSYDKEFDTTIQSSKSQVISTEHPVFLIENDFIIPIPPKLLSGYQDVVITEALWAIRQETNPTVARRANAFMTKLQQDHRRIGKKQSDRVKYGRGKGYYGQRNNHNSSYPPEGY